MKKYLIILLLLAVIVFAGCVKNDTPPPPAMTLPLAPTETTTVSAEPELSTTEATFGKEEDRLPDISIDTAYYTIALFDEWADSCVVELHEMHSGLPIVSLYEKTSYEEFGGGKLCSIQMMKVEDDTYKDFPSYEWLGELETPDGRYNIIVLFPTDVQFSENTAAAYQERFDKIHDVLYTLSPREGMELMMPAPTLPQ